MRDSSESKVVVYTASIGKRSTTREVLYKNDAQTRVAFLSDTSLDLDTWTVCKAEQEVSEDPRRCARYYKTMPQVFFPDADYWIWVDSSLMLKRDPEELINLYLDDADIAIHKHPRRDCLFKEAVTCTGDGVETFEPLDDPKTIFQQVKRYRLEGMPDNFLLCETGFLLRKNTPQVVKFNEAWWNEIKSGSRRDQISFPYCICRLGIPINILDGNVGHTHWTHWVGHTTHS